MSLTSTVVHAQTGRCLDLIDAGQIVQASLPNGPHDIDKKLIEAGIGEVRIFIADVENRVRRAGCGIKSGALRLSEFDTLREARRQVRDAAE